MALLKVIFPHQDDAGKRYEAGVAREVPDNLVDLYTGPYPGVGFPVMSKYPNIVYRTPGAEFESTVPRSVEAPKKPEPKPEIQAEPEAQPETPAPEVETEVPAEVPADETEAPKAGKKRSK